MVSVFYKSLHMEHTHGEISLFTREMPKCILQSKCLSNQDHVYKRHLQCVDQCPRLILLIDSPSTLDQRLDQYPRSTLHRPSIPSINISLNTQSTDILSTLDQHLGRESTNYFCRHAWHQVSIDTYESVDTWPTIDSLTSVDRDID